MHSKNIIGSLLLCVAISLTACNNSSTTQAAKPIKTDTAISYNVSMVNNTKDPICDMPVTAGISDTAVYNGKTYGFCGKGCKDEFVKNPAQYVTAAQLKK